MKKHSEYINKIVFVIVRYLGIPYIIREFVQRNKVTIYLLHNVSIVKAKIIFSTLKSYYNIISLKQYVNAVEKGQPLPKKAAIITFDDGYIENYNLLPLIKEMNIPITIYICSELINTKDIFGLKTEIAVYQIMNLEI